MKSFKKRNRFLSLLLVICMLVTLVPGQVFAAGTGSGQTTQAAQQKNPFTDVKSSDWFYDAVQYVRVNGLFAGTSSTTFTPNGTMTRGMFVTVLGRMAGVDVSAYSGDTGFSDVAQTQYYAPYVKWAAKHGITSGTSKDKFSPNAFIDRQQMAAFFVRYFDKFNVEYDTGSSVSTTPSDINSVASYARDAVLKLWQTGLLNGSNGKFDPKASATRAQTATLCMRADNSVKTWYKEPGVASDRVKVDPDAAAEEPGKTEDPSQGNNAGNTNNGGSGSGGSSGGGGGSSTTYYEVKFAMVNGKDASGVTWPASTSYKKGTAITEIATPFRQNSIFLGWYYDAAGEKAVESGDTVDNNMTLYADMAEGQDVSGMETPNYVTVVDQSTGFTFGVTGGNIKSGMKLTCITAGNDEMSYNVSGTTVSAAFEAGQTYQFELTDDNLRFVVNGVEQDSHVRYLNVLTKKAEVANAELNSSLKYVPSKDVSGLDSGAYGGLFSSDISTQTTQTNETKGTFKYSGDVNISAGDTVAIYAGKEPDKRNLLDADDDKDEIAYVKITNVSGDTYSYDMADVEDVLLVPDVLPVPVTADKDGDDANNSITVENTVIQKALADVNANSIDEGDYIAFYSGTYNGEGTAISSYAEITKIFASGTDFIIQYKTNANKDIESALDSTLDVHYEQDEKIEMSDKEISDLEDAIKNDVLESGYVEQASKYLAAYALETDGFSNVPADMDINAAMDNIGELKATLFGSTLRAGKSVKVDFDRRNIAVRIQANTRLDKLSGNGVKVEVSIPFEVSIGDKVKIKVTAKLNEQVILKTSIGTKRIKIGFLKYDYALNAGFNVGNYTGIEFTADVTTDGDEESLSKKLDEIMDIMEQQSEGAGVSDVDGTVESISDVYKNLMDNANDTWIDLVDQKIFGSSGNAFLHIFCWEIKGSFVVSANLNVSIGMKYEYTAQKQYNFSVRVKARTSTNQTIDIITPHYNFDFYVVGMLGVRAGIRLEMYVGLFSLKIDRIGIMAEVGAYAQLWGYFFYHLEWTQGSGKSQNYAGAMLIEIGTYIDIKFLAQLFNSSKLSWNPTIYAHQWPMWSAGSVENIYGFANDPADYEFKTVKTLAIPGDTFLMKSMNLKTGDISNVSKDDASESNFTISFSNKAFSYDPKTNTVTVTPSNGSVAETTDMTVTWKNAPLALSSKPISKVLKLNWSDPDGVRYISFDSQGGSAVDQITGGEGAPVSWPADPVKEGYTFGGWYTNAACTGTAYSPVNVIPTFTGSDKGVTLYAKWTPAEVNYIVEYYTQELNGTYMLSATQTAKGLTDSQTPESYMNPYTGFTMKTPERKTVAADGSTVIQLYLNRNEYTVKFDSGTSDIDSVTQTYLYGADLQKPVMTRLGYKFAGWENDPGEDAKVTGNAVYTAKWTAEPVTYKVKHIRQSVDGSYDLNGDLVESELKDSFTDAQTNAEAREYPGFTAQPFEQKTTAADGSTVVEIMYERNSYNVSWNVNGGSELTGDYTNGDVKYGTPIVKPADPTKTGYVFGGWYTDSEYKNAFAEGMIVPIDGITLYAKWDASKDTKYTVEHYQQTLMDTDTGYEFHESEMLTGTTAQPTTAAAKVYIGFTARPFEQEVIAADGSTVVKIYYDRNTYNVSWNVNGGSELTGDYTNGDVKFGTPVIKPAAPTKTGYVFGGWYTDSACTNELTDSATVPVGGLTLYAKWDPSSDTKYTVRHYQQDLGDAEYTLTDTDEMTGTTGQQTAAKAKDYEGFTAEAVEQKTIAADGTTVIEIRYSRNSYNVSWNVNGGSALTGDYTNGSVKYGTTIVLPADPTKQGYVFSGWYLDENMKERIPENATVFARNITLYAGWDPADGTAYKVNYYKQNLANDEYTLAESKDMTGVTDDLTNAEDIKYEGFTMKSFDQQKIKPDGSTVVDIYYDRNSYNISWDVNAGNALTGTYTNGSVKFETPIVRPADPTRLGYSFGGWYVGETLFENSNVPAKDITISAKWIANTDTKYTVEYYTQNLENDEYTVYRTVSMAGTTDEPANAEIDDIEGFTAQDFERTPVAADGSTVIKIYYSRNSYNISWDMNGGDALTVDDHTKGTVKYGSAFKLPSVDPTRAGYLFIGWYLDKDGNDPLPAYATVPAKDLTIYAKWQSEGTKYLVKYYTENLYDDDYTVETVTKYGKSGEMTEAEFPDKEGFVRSGDSSQVEIAGDGSTILEVRYKRNRYTVEWDLIGGTGDLTGHSPDGSDVKYGTPIVFPEGKFKKDGFKLRGWCALNYDGVPMQLSEDSVICDTLLNNPSKKKIYIFADWLSNSYAKYSVKWETNGGSELEGDYTHGDDLDYNQRIYTPYDPTKEGYLFEGWYTDKDLTIPLDIWNARVTDDMIIYAKWVPDTYVKYTVKYMLQNADDDDYTTPLTVTKLGEPGAETEAVVREYEDFETPEVTQQTIAADGSTVVEIKYARKKCTVYWVRKDGTFAHTSVRYGAIAVAPDDSELTKSLIVNGKRYIFKGWYTDEECTKPLGDSTRIYDTDEATKIYAGYDVDSTYAGYGITVAGVEVTNKNCSDILSTGDNKGKVSYDRSTNTLTLNNVNIEYNATETYINSQGSSSVIITDPNISDVNGDLKIKLIGSNTIRNTHAPYSSTWVTGILVNGSLTIEGDSSASLTVEVADNSVGKNRAIYFDKNGKMYINGPEVIANAGSGSSSHGIYAGSELEPADICIQSGSLEVNGYTAGMAANVKQVYSATDSGSYVTVTSASTEYNGSFASGVSFTSEARELYKYKHIRIAIEK